MDAHLPETAGADDVRAFDTDDAAAALDSYFKSEGEDLDDEELPDDAETTEDGDDAETEATDEAEDDKPEAPAIDAPQSLTADEKAIFAQLPPEAQRVWAASESRRNTQVQQATTQAAEAQREAKAAAANADAQAKATYAQQYRAFVSAYAPQQPDANLAYTNPAEYIAQKAQYDAAFAQHTQLVQQIDALEVDAVQYMTAQQQQWQAEQARELMKMPEFADPAKRGPLMENLTAIGTELGYSPELMADASAADILALKTAHDWKAKAVKWDALQARKMQPVRDAKTSKPGTARPVGAGRVRTQTETLQRVRQSGRVEDAASAIAALG